MQRQLTLSPIYLLIGLASSTAYAGGFQINEHSATGLGRAFAGDAVIGDNASVVSRNAAAMTLFKQNALSFGVTYVKPDVTVKNAQYHRANINVTSTTRKSSAARRAKPAGGWPMRGCRS